MAKPKRAHRMTATGAGRSGANSGTARQAARGQSAASSKASGNGTGAAPRTNATTASADTTRNGTSTSAKQSAATARNGAASAARGHATSSSAARTIASRAATQQTHRRRQPQSWWQQAISGQRGVLVALGAIAIIVVLFIVLATRNGQSNAEQPVPASVLHAVTNVSPSVSAKVGTGGLSNPFKATPSGTAGLTSGGKPEFFYAGGEFCPFCAAERWSMIVALSRFGTFSNLHLITSSEDSIPTFTFYKSSYTSPYLVFTPKEIYDQNRNPLETLDAQHQALYSKYDQAGSIPFLNIGDRYFQIGGGYQPSIIASDTWQSIATALGDPSTPEAQNIIGNANYITAAICKVTNNQPANVCTVAPIPSIEQKLP